MDDDTAPASARNRIWLFVPVLCFMALAVMFYVRLDDNGDPARLPSALLGRSIPVFTLPPLEGLLINGLPVPGFSDQDAKTADPKAAVTAINIFASWCGPCRDEHPVLLMLAKDPRVRVWGINYKDKPDNARRFLGALGNPSTAVGADVSGRTGIDFGVYGVPETFFIGPDGRVLYKHVGPLTLEALKGPINDVLGKASKPSR